MSKNLHNQSPEALHLLEQNVDAFSYEIDTGDDIDGDFEVILLSDIDKHNALNTVDYFKTWYKRYGVEMKQKRHIENAFQNMGVLGLFHVFLNRSFFNCLQICTCNCLCRRVLLGRASVLSKEKLGAYLGLEMVMSICKFNQISDY